MNNEELYSIYTNLVNSLPEIAMQENDSEDSSMQVVINAIKNEDPAIYTAAFSSVVADMVEDLPDFDAALFLYREVVDRNESDQTLDDDDFASVHKKITNLQNNGYRRFKIILANTDNFDVESLQSELKLVIQEGYQSAKVWGWLGSNYADSGNNACAVDAFRNCIAIDNESQELTPEMRKGAEEFLKK